MASRRYLAYVPAAVILVRKRRSLGLPVPLSAALTWAVPVATARGLRRGRARAALVWAAQMWAYKVSFEMPHDKPDGHYRRTHIDYPIALDRVLGAGTAPSQRLQRALRRAPALSGLDRALSLFYMTWEAEPHAALAWILLRHPERFLSCAIRLGGTFDATLLGYFGVPTAPPWWASEREGRLDRSVRRVTLEVMRDLKGEPRPSLEHNPGSNPWASMPSDHFGSASAVAMLLYELHRGAGLAAWAYALALGGTLVYLGEHYVVDLIAGLSLAVAINRSGRRFDRPVARLLIALGGG